MMALRPIVIDEKFMILGGNMRLKALQELGYKEIPSEWIKQAKDLTPEQKKEFIIKDNLPFGEWDFDLLANQFEMQDLLDWGMNESDLDINLWNDKTEEQLDDVPEIPKEALSKTGDIFLIDGKHRVMCGDSTLKADVEALMAGKKADMVFTDPPYGMFLDTDFSSMKNNLKFAQEKGVKNGKKYKKVIGDNEDFKPELINTVFNNFGYCKEIFLFGADYYSELIENKNDGSWIVWDKRLEESADKMYGSCFELCYSKTKHKRSIARIKWAAIFGTEQEPDHKRYHPNQKPVILIKWFFEYFSLINKIYVTDLYLGVGSTLIASEQTKRICYGMEIDPIYIDVILTRYKNLYPESKFECLNRKFDFEKLWLKK